MAGILPYHLPSGLTSPGLLMPAGFGVGVDRRPLSGWSRGGGRSGDDRINYRLGAPVSPRISALWAAGSPSRELTVSRPELSVSWDVIKPAANISKLLAKLTPAEPTPSRCSAWLKSLGAQTAAALTR